MKTILLTGATGAVGNATAHELAKRGANLVLIGRSQNKLQDLSSILIDVYNQKVDTYIADLSDFKSVRTCCSKIKEKYSSIDGLLNIAAVYKKNREVNSGGLEYMFSSNHLGPFVLTNELLPLLQKSESGRIVTVSAPSFTKLNFEDINAEKKYSPVNHFGASKMANLLFSFRLAKALKGSNVVSAVFHPGLVKSEIGKEFPGFLKLLTAMFSKSPNAAANMLSNLMLEPKYQDINGKFYRFDGKELKPNEYAYNEVVQEKLWTVSEELTAN